EPWGAVCGGLTYALFSQGTINQGWQGYNLCDGFSLPGIPFAIWALARISLQSTPIQRIGVDWRAAGLGALVGLGQTFPFAIFYFVAYFLWFAVVKPRKGLDFWILFAVFTLGWFATEALPIWASVLNAPLSQRAHWNLSLPPFGGVNRYSSMAISLAGDNW